MPYRSVFSFLALLLPLCSTAQLFPQLGAQRAGISALTFLKMDVSPRSAALASANICLGGDAFSTYTNPATLPEAEHFELGLTNTFWIADINYAFLSSALPTKWGHFGLSLSALNSGPMKVRTTFQPEGTGEYFYANYYTVGASYAQQLTDNFGYGFTLKYVHEQLAEFTANTAVVDLGFLYQTDIKDLRFAVFIQNFGPNSTLSGSTQRDTALNNRPITLDDYPAPTVFKLGFSLIPYKSADESQHLELFAQLNHPNDNAENIRLGGEFVYKSLLFLRAGYKINIKDQDYPTAGFGVRTRLGRHPLVFDYAMDPMRYLGFVHRIGLTFKLNPREAR